ncbi:MAG: DMT family transporter, partial [Bacillota bacterium]
FEYTNVGNAVIFIALQPLFTYILEYLFAREDLKEGVLLGIFMAMIGSVIISMGDLAQLVDKLWGDLLAIMAAFFAACYLFSGRSLRNEIEYFPYLYLVYTYAAIFLGLFALIRGISFTGHGFINHGYFLALALGPTLIGHSVLNYSVRFLSSTIVSLAILGEPILTTILAWFILQEKITLTTFIGGLFILMGIYKASVKKQKDRAGG